MPKIATLQRIMARQKLGQNFLSQISWRTRIAETLPASPDSTWLEIGAGHGEMTELLATRARRVIAVETDAALAASLRERAAHFPANATGSSATPGSFAKTAAFASAASGNVEVIHADILSLDLAALICAHSANDPLHSMPSQPADEARTLGGRSFSCDTNLRPFSGVLNPEGPRSRQGAVSTVPKGVGTSGASAPEAGTEASDPTHRPDSAGTRFRVYGNLPYYITSPILSLLFRFADQIDSIHIVTQLEVAQRIAAKPHSRDYGYLSTLCQFYAHPELLFRIPPGAFQPPPKVTSALVEMHLPGKRSALGIHGEPPFLKFLQLCFAHKRKTLRNNLRGTYANDAVAKALAAGVLTDNARAEELTLPQFAQIFRSLTA
ncbi:MAG: rRNA adenine dimethyltransferase family protein [Candidatus Acidiferrales bacterium]